MPVVPYIKKHLFRMSHIDNLRIILKDGMYAPNVKQYPDYINIGDVSLIEQRSEYRVPIPPGGVLSDYVPFYFGGHSPMLLKIKTGHGGVKQWNQRDIVFICTHIQTIVDTCPEYCFTNGHAKDKITEFFNQLTDLDKVDWKVVDLHYWTSTEEDPDLMRRKQAEFLVKNYVPLSCISGLIVLDAVAEQKVRAIMAETACYLPIYVDNQRKYYYND